MRRLLTVAGLTLAVLLSSLSAAAAAVAPATPPGAARPEYVALGDSYASGVGTGSYLDDEGGCQRSSYAYPALLARARGYALRFRACSGATIAHVRGSQLGALSARTRYVSLSVGGNDAGFAQVLTTCATPWWLADCDPAVDRARAVVRDLLPGRLRALYAEVRDRAPRAKVVVVGYPRIFMGTDCDLGTWFTRAEQQRLNQTADLLNARTARAARAAGFAFAHPGRSFRGHAVCDDPAWLNGLSIPVGESYHPNRAGHAEGLLPLVRPLLRGAGPAARPGASGRSSRPAPAVRTAGTRAAPFRRPDLRSPRAERAAEGHGIDIEAWWQRHP
ncbi:SGNH/GDSL hydrolase family protein [Nocardioides sp. W7]|uniref:SGNH/GDSL hydrolase family protein n=1 Tax=Nocardioides sp. W7 TaxID=2931390 RepID=UPI001FD427FC|nr:SGNH/GDSL hydrolase family protein [Nocardioides sp. W7]